MSHDILANGRGFSIAVEGGYTDSTTTAFRILDESGSVVVRIMGDGSVTAPNLNISSIPTSASGLSAGDVWSDSGTLKIV